MIMIFAICGTQINSMPHLYFHKSMSTTLSWNNYFPFVLLVFSPISWSMFPLLLWEATFKMMCLLNLFLCQKSNKGKTSVLYCSSFFFFFFFFFLNCPSIKIYALFIKFQSLNLSLLWCIVKDAIATDANCLEP